MAARSRMTLLGATALAVALGLACRAAFADVIIDSLVTSSLSVSSDSGTASISSITSTSAATGTVQDSLGDVNGQFSPFGTTTDVTASASIPYAGGTASSLASTTTVSAEAKVNITVPLGVVAGDTSPGAIADLQGIISITGATADTVNLTFTVTEVGSLFASADSAGTVDQADTATLLFINSDYSTGPDAADLQSLTPGTDTFQFQPFSQTLTATITVDPTQPQTFDLGVFAEAQGENVPEPGSLSLLLGGMGILAWRRRAAAQTRIGTD